jgi:steroid 5-alpha reductase family enzyme
MPLPIDTWLLALPWLLGAAAAAWAWSVAIRNVTLVDTLWSLMFLLAAVVYAYATLPAEPRTVLLLVLVGLWALRLAVYLGVRTLGHAEEDARYQAIRRRNEPGFAWKSLYLVFGMQAVLAWVISMPLLGGIAGEPRPLGVLDAIGVALWLLGWTFETVGDWQLARFKADPTSAGQVMDRGLWRYTRHPNYFGDFCVWWGFYAIALATGAWWSIAGPVIMSVLLLRVSGVTLLERHIGKRRPGYAEYARRTNAFFPGPPRQ